MRKFNNIIRLGLVGAAAAGAVVSGPALASGGKAMTWGVYDYNASTNVAQKAAWAALIAADNDVVEVGCKNVCNAYQGDTSTATPPRPILCIVPGNLPEPPLYAAVFTGVGYSNTASSNWKFYNGWSGGKVGLTVPVLGKDIINRAYGDAMCRDPKRGLGDPNARMAEHHDNKVGGWALGARIHPNSKAPGLLKPSRGGGAADNDSRKFWVAINDQTANPWNP